jgi:hypothetical protein
VKRAFGVISALIIMLLIATLMVAVVKFAFISVKHTSDSYLIQRAQLFMQSSIENAILAIEGNDRKSNGCLKNIHFTDENNMFEANITVLRYYCFDENDCNCNSDLINDIQTDKSHGYVLMKIVVESNTSHPRINKNIRLEKVTLQRP